MSPALIPPNEEDYRPQMGGDDPLNKVFRVEPFGGKRIGGTTWNFRPATTVSWMRWTSSK